jgi:ubiquinone/menaquinone biosynthesis C-methylase UbiE
LSEHKHAYADEKTRRQWQIGEDLLPKIGLRAGMVFMDIGCGVGFFTIPAAEITGSKGKVYAVDADESAIDKLKIKAAERRLTNIVARVEKAEQTVFCEGCADIVFYSMVLHDFSEPERVLQNAKLMIKATGRLANLDWKEKQSPFGPPLKIRFSEAKAASLIEAAGFKVENVRDVGQYHYIVTAKP